LGTTHTDGGQAERLLAVGRSLVSDLDLESILEQVLRTARELTGAQYAALGVLDDDKRELERFLFVGIDEQTRRRIGPLPRGGGVLGELIRNPEPLRLPAVGDHPRSFGFPPGHPPMTTFLGVPIAIRGDVYGNLYLTEKHGGVEFTDEDERAAIVLADWAGVAISNARLYAAEHERRKTLEQAVDSLEATTAIARALGGETDLDVVLDLIAKRGRALVEARWAAITILDGEDLELRATAGDLPMRPIGHREKAAGTLAGETLRRGIPRSVTDLSQHASEEDRSLVKALGAERALFVPLEFRGRGVGLLVVASDAAEDFTPEQEQLLEAFAASAATAVATAQTVATDRLRQSVAAAEQERRRWARELHDETLQELGAVKMLVDTTLAKPRPESLRDVVGSVAESLQSAIAGLHRMITELRPAALDELGVAAAVNALAERRRTDDLDIAVSIDLDFESERVQTRLAPEVESAIYRIVQESLTNVHKHAQADRVEVLVLEEDDQVTVEVRDDGRGLGSSDTTGTGLGLAGMDERVSLLGGTLEIRAGDGGGTTVHATLPALHASNGSAAG
jgi:two-component system, NarL family, sensor histidine kinase DevS